MSTLTILKSLITSDDNTARVNMEVVDTFNPEENLDYTYSHTTDNGGSVYLETKNFDFLKSLA